LEYGLEKPKNEISKAYWAILVGAQMTETMKGMRTVEAVLRKLQRPCMSHWARNLFTFCLCPEIVYKAKLKGDRLVILVGKCQGSLHSHCGMVYC
jgi:hypothetical protein